MNECMCYKCMLAGTERCPHAVAEDKLMDAARSRGAATPSVSPAQQATGAAVPLLLADYLCTIKADTCDQETLWAFARWCQQRHQ